MKISEVSKLSTIDRFFYWIRERHQIYLKRKAGKSKPWTDDEVLQRFFFTNPYRENDKVTVWFRDRIRDPWKNCSEVIFATICFRWFNLPSTGEILIGGAMDPSYFNTNLLVDWNCDEALLRLGEVRDRGEKVFTGAFMINSPAGEPKLEAICRRIDNVWKHRGDLIAAFDDDTTMEGCHAGLTQFDGLGGFMAYEIVCDLRYTTWLENAPDKLTWCNPGPGAIRGLYRIAGEDWGSRGNNAAAPPRPKDWQIRMINLLDLSKKRLKGMPPLEMREIEHSLCEFDKYERARTGDGRMKRTYKGV